MPATYTPIRYPGGKTKLYGEVRSVIEANDLLGCTYYEAFAGGAGLACKLLLKDDVSRIVINDIDKAVYCMWKAIVDHSDDMCRFIDDAELNVEEWKRHREIFQSSSGVSEFELGKSAFYLNRTNISGILKGGVIGGLEQLGHFKIDARFNKETLKRKIRALAAKKNCIEIFNLDAEDFIQSVIEAGRTFAYFDPPYVQKGPGLYRNSYDDDSHRSLGTAIANCPCAWMVTYDNSNLVDEIYGNFPRMEIDIRYSAQKASVGKEKLILKPGLVNPLLNASCASNS